MNEATVQDELDFENLPQETKDLVKRLFAAEYFGEVEDVDEIDNLQDKIDDLEDEIVELEREIKKLEGRYDEGYENGYDSGYEAGYGAGQEVNNS